MDREILMLLIGGGISIFSSLMILVAERILDKKGKLNIFYKFVYQKNMGTLSWGVEKNADGQLLFTIPVIFEFQNTSNTTRVIRDVSLLLYKENEFICNMHQINHMHVTSRKGSTVTGEEDCFFGTDKGSYSFVIAPRSIQRQECEYVFKIKESEKEIKAFDTIKLRYFDERNKQKVFLIKKVKDSWKLKYYDVDQDWILVK